MSDQRLPTKCIIHVHPADKGKLLPWRHDNWEVLQRAVVARKASKRFHSSKYRPFIEALPDDPGENDGYHSKCYQSFTAVSIPQTRPISGDAVGPDRKLLRSDVAQPTTSSSSDISDKSKVSRLGFLSVQCFFCEKVEKRRPDGTKEQLGSLQTDNAKARIEEVAKILKLPHLIVKLSAIDPISKELKFHHSCRSMYYRRADRAKGFRLSSIEEEPVNPKYPLQCIYKYVKKNVIDKKRPERLTSIYEHYTDLCNEHEVDPLVSKVQYLGDLLVKEFPGLLSLHSPECRQHGIISYQFQLCSQKFN